MKPKFTLLFGLLLMVGDLFAGELFLNERQQVLLRFPAEIRYADFGSGVIEGQVLRASRILRVKSKVSKFEETNLSVVTADGKYYDFQVRYADRLPYILWEAGVGGLPSDTLCVGGAKTTHLIAEAPIMDYVLGNDSLIAMPANRIDNMLKLKARSPFVGEASVAVVGSSGQVYSFLTYYNETQQEMTRHLGNSQNMQALFNEQEVNEYELRSWAQAALHQKPFMSNLGVVAHKMEISLTGIYSCNDVILFCLHVQNTSQIDYAVDFMKMYICDTKQSRHTASQEEELTPLFLYFEDEQKSTLLPGNSGVSLVLCFRRFTLPVKRGIFFELFERNGGRHLRFSVPSKSLLKTRKLIHSSYQNYHEK